MTTRYLMAGALLEALAAGGFAASPFPVFAVIPAFLCGMFLGWWIGSVGATP